VRGDGERVRPGVERVYFSLDPRTRSCCATWNRAGAPSTCRTTAIVLADGGRHQALFDVESMPVALGGAARYNIANGWRPPRR
jgi:cyanophycin synthetase